MNYEREMIDVTEILYIWRRHIRLIILSGLCLCLAAYFYSAHFVAPKYQASAMLIVNSGDRGSSYITQDQLNSSSKLVGVCAVIMQSEPVVAQVTKNLGLSREAYGQKIERVQVNSVNKTQIMQISVESKDGQLALQVCEQLTKVLPDTLIRALKTASVELISPAGLRERAVSPNIRLNTVYGLLLGLLAPMTWLALVSIGNYKVRGEADISRMGVPVLGFIPPYEQDNE